MLCSFRIKKRTLSVISVHFHGQRKSGFLSKPNIRNTYGTVFAITLSARAFLRLCVTDWKSIHKCLFSQSLPSTFRKKQLCPKYKMRILTIWLFPFNELKIPFRKLVCSISIAHLPKVKIQEYRSSNNIPAFTKIYIGFALYPWRCENKWIWRHEFSVLCRSPIIQTALWDIRHSFVTPVENNPPTSDIWNVYQVREDSYRTRYYLVPGTFYVPGTLTLPG